MVPVSSNRSIDAIIAKSSGADMPRCPGCRGWREANFQEQPAEPCEERLAKDKDSGRSG